MTKRRRYASDSEGKRLAALAREMGVSDVAGVDFYPDGRVRILDARAAGGPPNPPGNSALDETDPDAAFEQWKNGGHAGRV
ncbi:hypothetical protein [Vitreimonas flagellata]|uniref:hypothetical protein n=1 Tax=Vitreimonas flagellata TaxID=2560861 RepID=UPI0010752228|nr:hypothetical protein [Vitreimonas flagellata]